MGSESRPLPSWEHAIGEAIAERRKSLELTEQQFADRYKISVADLRKWERGEDFPAWERSFGFLRVLGNETREKFHIHLGSLIDEIRQWSEKGQELRSRAFDALAIVFDNTNEREHAEWVRAIEDAAASYAGLKKEAASVQINRKPKPK